jgi:methionyl-tRNA synthetase
VDATVRRFQELWVKLGITHDDFIRTTEPRHTKVVQAILQDLFDRGEIYKADYDGCYCVACERFFTRRDPSETACPDCGRTLDTIKETNYFFRMSRYQDWLVRYIQEHPAFIQPEFRRNETLGFLQKPLNDLCISRHKSRVSWGIELPFDKDYVTYVWFDALVNYISAVGYRSDDARFRQWWPASYHLIGKDILTTHTVYWPTMLKAMGLPMPEAVFAHGWWLTGDAKMSKTAGNTVNPMAMAETFGPDAFRYFLLAEMSLGQDAAFSEEAFARRYNADLANDLGNLFSRMSKLVSSHFGGSIPPAGAEGPLEEALRQAALGAAREMMDSVERMRPDLGLAAVAGVVREANRYLEKRQPWSLAKAGKTDELGTVLYTCAEVLRLVSGLLYPVMPGKMLELRRALGLGGAEPLYADLSVWGRTQVGAALGPAMILFPKIAPPAPATVPPPAKSGPPAPPGVALIAYEDFAKTQLRTARILAAERIEGADKLLKLQIELGAEKRQLVAGIAQHYAPEDLPGKTIVVVANLAPARIRGVESNGMLLAASHGKDLRLVTVEGGFPSGATVK